MAIDISSFRATVSQKGYLPNNRFRVSLVPPPGLRGAAIGADSLNPFTVARDVQFYASTINLPGVSLTTTDHLRYGYGMVTKRPFGIRMQDVSMNVYVDSGADTLNFMRSWIKLAANYDFGDREVIGDPSGYLPDQRVFELAYPKQYLTDVDVMVYDYNGSEKMKVTLIEAYPISVSDVGLSWSAQDQVMTFSTTLTYSRWYTEDIKGR